MRLKQKFKIFKQLKHWQNANYFPTKLFTTTKKSWKLLLSTYNINKNKKILKKSKFLLNSIVKVKSWDFNRKSYKAGLEIKRYYYHIFDSIIKNKILKRIYLNFSKKYKENNFINHGLYLVKPNFRLDLLIWLVGFSNSVYEARNFIFSRNILLNHSKNPNPSNLVNTGDIISVNFIKDLTFKKINKKKIYFKNQFTFFCEVDYYAKNIIIVNDFSDMLKSYDNPQIFFKKVDIRKMVTYLKREY
jgi:ribosomal protein S4